MFSSFLWLPDCRKQLFGPQQLPVCGAAAFSAARDDLPKSFRWKVAAAAAINVLNQLFPVLRRLKPSSLCVDGRKPEIWVDGKSAQIKRRCCVLTCSLFPHNTEPNLYLQEAWFCRLNVFKHLITASGPEDRTEFYFWWKGEPEPGASLFTADFEWIWIHKVNLITLEWLLH